MKFLSFICKYDQSKPFHESLIWNFDLEGNIYANTLGRIKARKKTDFKITEKNINEFEPCFKDFGI